MFFKKGNQILSICDHCFIESKEINDNKFPTDICYILFDDYISYNVCRSCYYKNGTLGPLKNINPRNSVLNMGRKIKRLELEKEGWKEI